MDDDDAELLAVGDALEAALLALVMDLAGIGAVRIDAAQNLHQRRLAGAVLTDQRVNLTGLDGDVDVVERLHARERLGDPSHLKDRIHRSTSGTESSRNEHGPCAGAQGPILARTNYLNWSSL
jgi:hypothetical protein